MSLAGHSNSRVQAKSMCAFDKLVVYVTDEQEEKEEVAFHF